MDSSRLVAALPLFLVAMAAPACDPEVQPHGDGGQGGEGGGGEIVCEAVARAASSEGCLTAECSVVLDTDVLCDDLEFGEPGVRVAPAANATWLATASSDATIVYRIEQDGAERVDEGLPPEYARNTYSIATDASGRLHLGVDATRAGNDYVGGAEHAVFDGTAWTRTLVHDRDDKYVSMINLEIGADDRASLWISDDAPETCVIAQQTAEGTFTTESAPTVTDGGGGRWFSLGVDAQGIAFDVRSEGLIALIDGDERVVGSTGTSYDYRVTHAPAPFDGALGPTYAALLVQPTGLTVVWPEGDETWGEVAVPGSREPVATCPFPDDDACTGSCVETSVGVEAPSFAIARTSDGMFWVAFVETTFDVDYDFEEECEEEAGCFCSAIPQEDRSTFTLRLFKVDPTTSTVEAVYASPIPRLLGRFTDLFSQPRSLDLRGYGTSLAIGMRLADPSPAAPAVRVMRIETAP